jgi:fluoride exporter
LEKLIIVAVGGAVGAIARYWLGVWISSKLPMQFPLGTFVINVTGSFIIGFFLTLTGDRITIHSNWRLLIAVGFVGAYTTFSTFEYETLKLIEEGNVLSAALNVTLSVVLGFIAVWLGVAAARRFYVPQEIAASLQTVIANLSRTGPKTGD